MLMETKVVDTLLKKSNEKMNDDVSKSMHLEILTAIIADSIKKFSCTAS